MSIGCKEGETPGPGEGEREARDREGVESEAKRDIVTNPGSDRPEVTSRTSLWLWIASVPPTECAIRYMDA